MTRDPRITFAETATALVDDLANTALVYAEISGQYFGHAERRHPSRVINVGIREQLLVSAAAGMALTGMRPIVHTFAPFLVERAFEQVKLDFSHQDAEGVLVSSGASFDMPTAGRTHQAPGDVALMDTLPGWQIHVPGHADEVEHLLRDAVTGTGRHYIRVTGHQNALPHSAGQLIKGGSRGVVVAVGPMLDPVLGAVGDMDLAVLYTPTVRPFDGARLRAALTGTDVVLVEPYLTGTSAHAVSEALRDVPHRLLSLGVGREELRRYGTAKEHLAAHGLDAAGLRRSIDAFMRGSRSAAGAPEVGVVSTRARFAPRTRGR